MRIALGLFILSFFIYMANVLFLAFAYYDDPKGLMATISWCLDHLWQFLWQPYVFLKYRNLLVRNILAIWFITAILRCFYTYTVAFGYIPLISEFYSYVFISVLFGCIGAYWLINSILIRNKNK